MESENWTYLERNVVNQLLPIFPNLGDHEIKRSIFHPSNHYEPLTEDVLLDRCIEDLLNLRTFMLSTSNETKNTTGGEEKQKSCDTRFSEWRSPEKHQDEVHDGFANFGSRDVMDFPPRSTGRNQDDSVIIIGDSSSSLLNTPSSVILSPARNLFGVSPVRTTAQNIGGLASTPNRRRGDTPRPGSVRSTPSESASPSPVPSTSGFVPNSFGKGIGQSPLLRRSPPQNIPSTSSFSDNSRETDVTNSSISSDLFVPPTPRSNGTYNFTTKLKKRSPSVESCERASGTRDSLPPFLDVTDDELRDLELPDPTEFSADSEPIASGSKSSDSDVSSSSISTPDSMDFTLKRTLNKYTDAPKAARSAPVVSSESVTLAAASAASSQPNAAGPAGETQAGAKASGHKSVTFTMSPPKLIVPQNRKADTDFVRTPSTDRNSSLSSLSTTSPSSPQVKSGFSFASPEAPRLYSHESPRSSSSGSPCSFSTPKAPGGQQASGIRPATFRPAFGPPSKIANDKNDSNPAIPGPSKPPEPDNWLNEEKRRTHFWFDRPNLKTPVKKGGPDQLQPATSDGDMSLNTSSTGASTSNPTGGLQRSAGLQQGSGGGLTPASVDGFGVAGKDIKSSEELNSSLVKNAQLARQAKMVRVLRSTYKHECKVLYPLRLVSHEHVMASYQKYHKAKLDYERMVASNQFLSDGKKKAETPRNVLPSTPGTTSGPGAPRSQITVASGSSLGVPGSAAQPAPVGNARQIHNTGANQGATAGLNQGHKTNRGQKQGTRIVSENQGHKQSWQSGGHGTVNHPRTAAANSMPKAASAHQTPGQKATKAAPRTAVGGTPATDQYARPGLQAERPGHGHQHDVFRNDNVQGRLPTDPRPANQQPVRNAHAPIPANPRPPINQQPVRDVPIPARRGLPKQRPLRNNPPPANLRPPNQQPVRDVPPPANPRPRNQQPVRDVPPPANPRPPNQQPVRDVPIQADPRPAHPQPVRNVPIQADPIPAQPQPVRNMPIQADPIPAQPQPVRDVPIQADPRPAHQQPARDLPIPPDPRPPEQPQALDPREQQLELTVNGLLEIFPKANKEYIRRKLNEGTSEDALTAILLEMPPEARAKSPATVKPPTTETKTTIPDYLAEINSARPAYGCQAAVDALQVEYLRVSVNDLRKVGSHNRFSYSHMKKAIDEGLKKANLYESARKQVFQQEGGENGRPKFTVINQDQAQVVCALLRNGRQSRPLSSIDPELQREIQYMKNLEKKDSEEQDEKLANELNVKEYEETDQLIECGCCYGEVPFEMMVQCYEGHLFCRECLQRYAQEAIFGQGKTVLSCMTDGCSASFPRSQLESSLPQKILNQYDERVQEEAINLADLQNLVSCPFCDFKALLDGEEKVFVCQNESCRKSSCRLCQVDWDEHFGKKCAEVEGKSETKLRTSFEEKMTMAKIRMCHRCKASFTKSDGCNKMTCRCGATMCYICRVPNINYDHFCRHPRSPTRKTCKTCVACSLWSAAEDDDERALQEAKKEASKARRDLGFDDKLIGAPEEPAAKKAKVQPAMAAVL